MENPFEQVKEFHDVFDPAVNKKPNALEADELMIRIHFMLEELVEYSAAISINEEELVKNCQKMKDSIDLARKKVLQKGLPNNDIVSQADALIDLLYFTYGTFVLMGVNPMPLFEIVHKANMGKLFADGKPRYDKITGKVLKPDNWERDFAPEGKIKAEIMRQKHD